VALADGPPDPTVSPTNCWLRVFTIGIQTRTVREGIADSREIRVLPLTASNRKGEYIYSKPGVGESLLAL
jgi:hypothetical protein